MRGDQVPLRCRSESHPLRTSLQLWLGVRRGLHASPLGSTPGYDKERLLLHRAAITTKSGDYDKEQRL